MHRSVYDQLEKKLSLVNIIQLLTIEALDMM